MLIQFEDQARLSSLAFAAALDASRWQDYFDHLARISGGVRPMLVGQDLTTGVTPVAVSSGYDPDSLDIYNTYYADKNLWARRFVDCEPGVPMSAEEMCPREVLEKSEFYNDWVLPTDDIIGGGGTVLFRDESRMFLLGGNIRRRDVDRLEGNWLDLVRLLAPQLQGALEIHRTISGLKFEQWASQEAGASHDTSIVILDSDRRIHYRSKRADEQIADGSVIATDLQGRLCFADPSTQQRLALGLKRSWDDHNSGPLVFIGKALDSKRRYVCRLASMDPQYFDSSPFGVVLGPTGNMHLLTAEPLDRKQRTDPDIVTHSALTKSETDIVFQFADGHSLRDISESRKVSLHTVRNQIKSAMAKLDVHRQVDLVRLVQNMK